MNPTTKYEMGLLAHRVRDWEQNPAQSISAYSAYLNAQKTHGLQHLSEASVRHRLNLAAQEGLLDKVKYRNNEVRYRSLYMKNVKEGEAERSRKAAEARADRVQRLAKKLDCDLDYRTVNGSITILIDIDDLDRITS